VYIKAERPVLLIFLEARHSSAFTGVSLEGRRKVTAERRHTLMATGYIVDPTSKLPFLNIMTDVLLMQVPRCPNKPKEVV